MAHLQISELIPSAPQKVFEFLCDPANQTELLKGEIDVELLTPEPVLRRGAEIHYQMTRFGLSHVIRFRIEDCVRGQRVMYRQMEGVFQSWTHVMRFEEHGGGQTLVTDIVDYKVPFGLLGYLSDDLYIKRDMRRIIEKRLRITKDYFESIRHTTSTSKDPATSESDPADTPPAF